MAERLNEIFMAVIDDPNACGADFDYRPCATQEIAIDVAIEHIAGVETDEYFIEEDKYTDKDVFLNDARMELENKDYVEANGIYYRILSLEMNY